MVTWRELGRFDDDQTESEDGRRAGTITSPGWSSSEMTLSSLRRFSRYAVSVRAYNSAGAGPPSPTVYATTADSGKIKYLFRTLLNTSELSTAAYTFSLIYNVTMPFLFEQFQKPHHLM